MLLEVDGLVHMRTAYTTAIVLALSFLGSRIGALPICRSLARHREDVQGRWKVFEGGMAERHALSVRWFFKFMIYSRFFTLRKTEKDLSLDALVAGATMIRRTSFTTSESKIWLGTSDTWLYPSRLGK